MRLEEEKMLRIAEHIDLWVNYMWHGRSENANWAMDYELEKCREMMKSISETQLKVLKKISFIAKLRHQLLYNDSFNALETHRLALQEINVSALSLSSHLPSPACS
nr:hypothetical protein [Tanacetum cinerariifolium]